MKTFYLKVSFVDKSDLTVVVEPVACDSSLDVSDKLEFYYKHMNCDRIDIMVHEDYDFIVDDEGLLKDNHVFHLFLGDKNEFQIAGDFLIGTRKITEDSHMELSGMTSDEVNELIEKFESEQFCIAGIRPISA